MPNEFNEQGERPELNEHFDKIILSLIKLENMAPVLNDAEILSSKYILDVILRQTTRVITEYKKVLETRNEQGNVDIRFQFLRDNFDHET